MKNGYTHPCTDKAFLCDVMLCAYLRRHIMNPHLRKHMWGEVETGGHVEWVQKFWEAHAPFIVNKAGGLDDILKCYPIQVI